MDIPAGAELRPVPGFPGYLASGCGLVVSTLPWRGRSWRVMKPCRQARGYLALNVYVEGRPARKYVHQLVALAFLGPPDDPGFEVRHLDGNPTNNAQANLAWGPPSENALDKIMHGRSLAGEANPHAKLAAADVREIRRLCAGGMPQMEAARRFGVGEMQVSRIIRRERWSSVA